MQYKLKIYLLAHLIYLIEGVKFGVKGQGQIYLTPVCTCTCKLILQLLNALIHILYYNNQSLGWERNICHGDQCLALQGMPSGGKR